MAELDRIKRNVERMVGQNAPEEDIDAYISLMGATVDQVRGYSFDNSEEQQRQRGAQTAVSRYRAENPIKTAITDNVRRVFRGTPIGSWGDEMEAGLASVLPKSMGGQPYKDALAVAREFDRQGDAQSTKIANIPYLGDVTAADATMLGGAVATLPFAPAVRAFQGSSMIPATGNAMLTGAGYGGVYGAGMGDSLEERGQNAMIGAGIGGGIGFAAPAVAGGLGYGYNRVAGRARPLQGQLQGMNRRAVDLVSEDMVAGGMADRNSRAFFPRQAQQLGPEGAIMDMSRRTQSAAGGVAASEGPGGQMIADTIRHRREFAPNRINRALDQALGPAENIPQFIENARRVYGQQAAPLYADFYARNIPITPAIREVIQRAQATGAIREAQRLMAAEGVDPRRLTRLVDTEMTPMTSTQRAQSERVPHGLEFDYMKRAIDDIAGRAAPGSNEQRIFAGLARTLRNEVDELLSPGNPQQSPWAQARNVSGDGIDVRNAVADGQQVFAKNLTPDQLQADMRGNSQLQNEAMMVGAREALRSEIGSAATSYRSAGDTAARRKLNSDYARQKLGMVAGQQQARHVGRRIDAENVFADTENRVLGNSVTAERTAARERYRGQGNTYGADGLHTTTLTGAALTGVRKIANALMRGAIDERRALTLLDSGRMLSAQGVQRDAIAQALLDYAQRNAQTSQHAQILERVARGLMEGSRAPIIDAVAN